MVISFKSLSARYLRGFTHEIVDGNYGLHSHDDIELVWHSAGRGVDIKSDKSEQPFEPGALVIHGAGCRHGQRNSETGVDACLHLQVSQECADYFGELYYVPCIGDQVIAHELRSLTSNHRQELPQAINDVRLEALLLHILELDGEASAHRFDDLESKLNEAQRYIRTHFQEISGLGEVAGHIALSEDYFRHQFKERFDIAPMEFIVQCRLEHAQQLLQHTSLGQQAIAEQSGFSNIRYFNTRFSYYMGMTPGQFRKSQP